eukprot:5466009-Karenia_brevis.AAC.1
MAHAVYRSWCSICVRLRSREWDHRKDSGKDRNFSEYAFDYCSPGDECGYKWTALVGKERKTGMLMATTVPQKGGRGMFAIYKCLNFIDVNGDAKVDILIKSDTEEAMK